METLEQIKARIEAAIPGARSRIVPNDSPSAQRIAAGGPGARGSPSRAFLRDDPELRFDYASNVTGVDWPDAVLKEKVKVKKMVDGVEKEVEETVEREAAGLSRSRLSSLLDGPEARAGHPPHAHGESHRTKVTCHR